MFSHIYSYNIWLSGLQGLRGPPGVAGPQGPPGHNVSEEVTLLTSFGFENHESITWRPEQIFHIHHIHFSFSFFFFKFVLFFLCNLFPCLSHAGFTRKAGRQRITRRACKSTTMKYNRRLNLSFILGLWDVLLT